MFQSDITNNIISKKIPEYISEYKKYLKNKLENQQQYEKIISLHQTNLTQKQYAGLYCKEIINIFEVTKQFNCSFKPLTLKQFEQFKIKLDKNNNNTNIIYLICILSDESTMYMKEHFQYLFNIIINIQNQTFYIDDNYFEIKINEYDPIMSKSRQYQGNYRYNIKHCDLNNCDKYYTKIILKKIKIDNMMSLPEEIYNYYNDIYLKLSDSERREEIKRIFPFLCSQTLSLLSNSTQKMKYFLYAKISIERSFHKYLMEIFEYQNILQLTVIFKRLIQEDLDLLFSCNNIEQQYEMFRKLTEDTDKGLTFDELINLMINKINEDLINKQVDNFNISLFSS